MNDVEFNLLDEPWVRVIRPDCSETELSLTDALLHAQDVEDLAGELPTQDVAVLRLLLAVMHAVFYRVDENGDEAPVEEAEDAYRRWKALWELGHLPQEPVRAYLERWRERFWLFHPEQPFGQVKSAGIGTEYSAAKLNGELSESGNKVRLFPVRSGAAKSALTYGEAARWLLYVNGFDDTSAKPKGKDLPSVGAGWLGKLGLITAKGSNLFETLMLNFVLLKDTDESVWEGVTPSWELPQARGAERVQIAMPDDQAALLTLQSRRLLLHRDGGRVTGYTVLGGDFFERKNAFFEQMTVWRPIIEKGSLMRYQPRRHDSARQMWRDFAVLAVQSDKRHRPGVVTWNLNLRDNGCLEDGRMMCCRIASVQYGDKDFFVSDVFSDSLMFHLELLTEAGEIWRTRVMDEVERCDRIAGVIGMLATELDIAAGGKGACEETAREQFYYRIDVPFREWLTSLDPQQDGMEKEERLEAWRRTAERIAGELGRELVAGAGPAAFFGRMVKVKKGKEEKEIHYSAPEALNHFEYRMRKLN